MSSNNLIESRVVVDFKLTHTEDGLAKSLAAAVKFKSSEKTSELEADAIVLKCLFVYIENLTGFDVFEAMQHYKNNVEPNIK